ncbi:hypothetical protein K492DRAFT_241087 [Lichtheimia hyalospora FSU 10163]|nr:hypothetical protein K492DRAFT_241087 [Lichtheimia hyalospora FSU 10163]
MIETNVYYLCRPHSSFTVGDASAVDKIKNATIQAQDCLDKLVSSLNERAILLLESGRLDSAMDDANIMTQIAPSSALGYLLIGRIYCLGGYYASAIKNYNYALICVPSRDPGHEQLVKERDTAYTMINKRIDFVSQLPFDVVTHHLIPWIVGNRNVLDIEEPNDYLDVSRVWRQRMALADGLHFNVAPDGLSDDGYRRLLEIAPFIKSCQITEPCTESLTKIINHKRFDSLKKWIIHGPPYQESYSVLSALRKLGRQLTHLEITYGHHTPPCEPYRLCDLLSACPNLKSLRIEYAKIKHLCFTTLLNHHSTVSQKLAWQRETMTSVKKNPSFGITYHLEKRRVLER